MQVAVCGPFFDGIRTAPLNVHYHTRNLFRTLVTDGVDKGPDLIGVLDGAGIAV